MKEYNEVKQQLVKEINKKAELQEKLQKLEDEIYHKENEYFAESIYGNIIKGFENFSKNSNQNKRKITYNEDDHIFSLSSQAFVKDMMKRQGEDVKDDYDDIEDSTEVPKK